MQAVYHKYAAFLKKRRLKFLSINFSRLEHSASRNLSQTCVVCSAHINAMCDFSVKCCHSGDHAKCAECFAFQVCADSVPSML